MSEIITKSIPDDLAEKEIRWFLKNKTGSGQNLVSILEIMDVLMLPATQIEKIMTKIKGAVEV